MTTIADLEAHRVALAAHCYRMLGSVVDADDAVQEALLRGWRAITTFDGRASLHTWLQRIATNVCLDAIERRSRTPRALTDVAPPAAPRAHWLQPVADGAEHDREAPGGDPAAAFDQQESVRLAFVAALQHLPARQRAALLLAEVLGWSAQEIADAIETSVAAVNSALQRARATIGEGDLLAAPADGLSGAQQRRLERYVAIFRQGDVAAFAGLLSEDAGHQVPSGEAAWAIRFRCWRGCGAAASLPPVAPPSSPAP
jgi:RNA polymerase sigma-70 factor (ECF subfamily)